MPLPLAAPDTPAARPVPPVLGMGVVRVLLSLAAVQRHLAQTLLGLDVPPYRLTPAVGDGATTAGADLSRRRPRCCED